MAELIVQLPEGAVSALVSMLTRPNLLIEAFVTHRAMASFFAPNANQLSAPFLDLNPLNNYLLLVIVEFNGFGFVGITFRRFGLEITYRVKACIEGLI